MYCHDDDFFFDELSDLLDELGIDKSMVESQPETFELFAYDCSLEKVAIIDAHWIAEHFEDERMDEDCSQQDEFIRKLGDFDFTKINDAIPSLWFPNNDKVVFTKDDMLEALKD